MSGHGTLVRYHQGACRCDACRAAAKTYESHRRRQQAYGRWEPYVDAEPARQHVRALGRQGIGWMRVAELAGVPRGGVSKLLYGDPKRNLAPSKRIRPETGRRLLSVQPDMISDDRLVDATRTVELVKAMHVRGYDIAWICRQVGRSNQKVLSRRWVRAGTARAVASLADACASTPGPSNRARARAARAGWTADALWDDPVPLVPMPISGCAA